MHVAANVVRGYLKFAAYRSLSDWTVFYSDMFVVLSSLELFSKREHGKDLFVFGLWDGNQNSKLRLCAKKPNPYFGLYNRLPDPRLTSYGPYIVLRAGCNRSTEHRPLTDLIMSAHVSYR